MVPVLLLILPAVTLTGEIREAGRLEPVRFATVRVVEAPGRSTRADQDGLFALELSPGDWTLEVTAPGYEAAERHVRLMEGTAVHVRVELFPAPLEVDPLEVVSTLGDERPGVRTMAVDTFLMNLHPTPVERDVLRAVQSLPAATPSSDFSGALYIRGGTPDQTRLFLDGAPLFNPYHLGGFASALDPSSVASAVLVPGGAPASEPSSLSGSLRVITREGGRDSTRIQGGVGLLSSRVAVDGPLWGGTGSYLLSLRRTYVDLATRAAKSAGLIDDDFPYAFTDAHGKLTRDIGRGGKLTVSAYFNREGLDDVSLDAGAGALSWSWGTQVVSARARGLLGGWGKGEIGAAVSRFAGGYQEGSAEELQVEAAFRHETLDARLEHVWGGHRLSVGGRVERTPFDYLLVPGRNLAGRLPVLDTADATMSVAVFTEHEWQPVRGLELRTGLRAEKIGAFRWHWLPRAGVSVGAGGSVAFSVAGGRYVQGFTSLRNEESGLASLVAYDLLLPAESVLPSAWDLTGGVGWQRGAWSLRADAYWKALEGVPAPPPETDPATAPLYLPVGSIESGSGRVRGIELSGTARMLDWDIAWGYRLQDERRTARGVTYTPRSDRTHRLTATGRRAWGDGAVNAALTWMSGQPFTPLTAIVPGVGGVDSDGRLLDLPVGRPLLGAHNSARLPGYLRLDLGVRGTWLWSMGGRPVHVEPYVSVLNVLNAKNVLWGEYEAGAREMRLAYGPQLPLLPSFGLRFRF